MKATYTATNVEIAGAGNSFTIDSTKPSSVITSPADGAKLNSLAGITGTASDNYTINKIQVAIKNLTSNTYWDGDSWEDTITWNDCTGTASWTYTSPVWATANNYLIQSKGTDTATNVEIPGAGNSFLFDNSSPATVITTPAGGANLSSQPANFSGSATTSFSYASATSF